MHIIYDIYYMNMNITLSFDILYNEDAVGCGPTLSCRKSQVKVDSL